VIGNMGGGTVAVDGDETTGKAEWKEGKTARKH
jgi:hypothetical protein